MAYTDLTARFTYELQTVFGDFSKLANNDRYVKENGWQDGTMAVFFQAATPTGWTRNTLVDGRALRVTVGAGGGVAGANDPGSSISLAHTHTIANQADHTHTLGAHSHHLATSGTDKSNGTGVLQVGTAGDNQLKIKKLGSGTFTSKQNTLPLTGGTYTTGAGGSHDHGGATDSQLLTPISLAYINVLFASKDTSSGYTDLTSTFVHNTRHVYDYLSQLAANDAFNYARRTPAGTVSLFASAAAPTGWTKLTSATGQLLRVVSGTAGDSGGTTDPGSTISLAHTHSTTAGGTHSHSMPAHQHLMTDYTTYNNTDPDTGTFIRAPGTQLRETTGAGSTVSTIGAITDSGGSGTSSTASNHTHTISTSLAGIALAYFNVIQASKDSAGAPASYTDMTAFFVDQAVLCYQDLQSMANNDAYLYYHTMPSAAVMFFFQSAAPLNWTKLTTQDDKLLRIVSDSSGATAGGTDLLSAVTLAHTHTISIASHSHLLAHTHTLSNVGSTFSTGSVAGVYVFGANDAELYVANNGGAGDTSLGPTTDSQTASTSTDDHNHGGATGSALSTLSIAYADVIMCSKN